MKSFYPKGLITLAIFLFVNNLQAQPEQFDFISANETDTIWLSRTNDDGHTSDYHIYGWWYFKSYKYSRNNHILSLNVENDGSKVYTQGVSSLSVLSSPKSLPTGPAIDHNLTFWMWEYDYNKFLGIHTRKEYSTRLLKSIDTTLYVKILPPKNLSVLEEGESQSFIKLNWERGTDIPENMHKYLIYKDGIPLDTINGSEYVYVDHTLPGTYFYEVKTLWEGKDTSLVSISDSLTASTFLLNLLYEPKASEVRFAWDPLEDIKGINGEVSIDGYRITRYDTAVINSESIILNTNVLTKDVGSGSDDGIEIPGYKYRYILQPYPKENYYPDTVYAKSLPDGGFEGRIESLTGMGVPGVKVCAIRLDTVPQDSSTRYCALSDQQGNFTIEEVYYYTGSDFMLHPSFKDHGFKLSDFSYYTENKFRLENGGIGGITFVDTSTFVVQGQIVQPGFNESCYLGLENIKVKLYRGSSLVDEAFTDQNSLYSFSIDSGGNYSFVPELFMHSFSPDSFSLNIFSDTTLATITDNTFHKLSGYVYGACKSYFGQASLKIHNGESDIGSCIDTIISTNNEGYYEILLPANQYTISVEGFSSADISIDNETVVGYFTSEKVDLKKDSVQYNFVYRNTPRLEVSGLSVLGCGDYEDIPIVKQDYSYPVQILVYDVFGESTCRADVGYVNILDKTGYYNVDTSIAIQGGEAVYFIEPGYPNSIADYKKSITITAYVEKENIGETTEVLVEGAQPLENTFVTTSPEIPLFILHDPPGDQSYAYLQKESSSQIAIGNIHHETENIDGYSNEWKACPRITIDIDDGWLFLPSFEFEIEAGWRRLRTVNKDELTNEKSETIIEMSHKQGYQTSSDPALTSSTGGDVYIGGAMNLLYAETKEIDFNYSTCQVDTNWDIFILPHSLATDFVYSENHIRNYLVPEFERLQNYYEEQQDDTASFFEDQKNIWLTALANNNKNLSDSSTFLKRISFDGGVGPIVEETTQVSTIRNSYEFHVIADTTVMRYWKVDVAGFGYERSKVKSKIKVETGTDSSYTSSHGTTTGFVLKDDDPEDKFMVNVYTDNVYGTPAFKLLSGNSSCPYESDTRPVEGVQLSANKYVAMVDDPYGTAVFRLQLANTGQTSEDREYNLFFHQGSNPDGAQITLGGSPIQAGIPIPYTLPSWGSNEATVTVKRGPEAFDYHNLMFTLESGCDDAQIIDTLLLNVHFKSTCSNLFMNKPAENWVLTAADQGKLKTRLGGYDRDLLNDITLQICAENDYDSWFSLEYLGTDDLEPEQTDVSLFLDELEDGNYEIRARLECSSGKVYTEPIKGRKDSHGPAYYGVPEPADNLLEAGDLISALFDESINPLAFSTANITVINETSGATLTCNAGCNDNLISIFPDFPAGEPTDDVYRVFVFGLEDLYGNRMTDTLSWMFTLEEKPQMAEDGDADTDGILNLNDNCLYTANGNQEDVDGNGVGNVCDTDMDGDEIANTADNCPYLLNTDQGDLDEDGIGDVCDCDDDGDMIADTIDNKPMVYNPNQIVGLPEYSNALHILRLWPNPAKDILYVEFADRTIELVEIVNVLGGIVYNETNINFSSLDIDLSSISSGIYLIRTTDYSDRVSTQKFIKE